MRSGCTGGAPPRRLAMPSIVVIVRSKEGADREATLASSIGRGRGLSGCDRRVNCSIEHLQGYALRACRFAGCDPWSGVV